MLYTCPKCQAKRLALGKCKRGDWWHCNECHNKDCAPRGFDWRRVLPKRSDEFPLIVKPTDPPPWGPDRPR